MAAEQYVLSADAAKRAGATFARACSTRDDRFGNASRLIQFCAVGASGMIVDLTCYALFLVTLLAIGIWQGYGPYYNAGLLVAGVIAAYHYRLIRCLPGRPMVPPAVRKPLCQ